MRWLTILVLVVCFLPTLCSLPALRAHHPDRVHQRPHPRVDVIGPLGTWLPMSHRRRYNRPSKIMGRISYSIAPSSQEAMAWHSAMHRGLYQNHRPRMEQHFFYPKPWEGLRIGPRVSTASDDESTDEDLTVLVPIESGEDGLLRASEDSISNAFELIEK
jgi:hypothetical protein